MRYELEEYPLNLTCTFVQLNLTCTFVHFSLQFNSALGFLGERREFWSQQKPAYPKKIRLSKGGATQKKASPLDDLLSKLMSEQRDKLLGTEGDSETAALFRVGSKRRQSIFGPMNAKTITTFTAYQQPKPAIL